jgi:hypothetical protein
MFDADGNIKAPDTHGLEGGIVHGGRKAVPDRVAEKGE